MNDDTLRQKLLERAGADLGAASEYRRKVEAMIQDRERALRSGAWAFRIGYSAALGVAIVLMIGAGLWFEGQLKAVWLGVNACFWVVIASVMALNRQLAKDRVETLKELKGIEMRVLEIQERLGER